MLYSNENIVDIVEEKLFFQLLPNSRNKHILFFGKYAMLTGYYSVSVYVYVCFYTRNRSLREMNNK